MVAPVISATRGTEAGELLEPLAEVAVSQEHAIALQPGAWRQSETLSQKKKSSVRLYRNHLEQISIF